MQYVEAVNYEKSLYRSLFLAGGITNCPDWQQSIVDGLTDCEITIYNPRRKIFPIDKVEESEKQILWEFRYLRESDFLLFWFSEGSINPIALFEYGAALERNQKLFVGVHENYQRKSDIEIQTQLIKPETTIHYCLENLLIDVRKYFSFV
jgi:hypothetical protein